MNGFNGNGDGKATVMKVVFQVVGGVLIFIFGSAISSMFNDNREVAALKVKTEVHDQQFRRDDERLGRIENKIDKLLERLVGNK